MRLFGWFRPYYQGAKPPIVFMWREWNYRLRRAWRQFAASSPSKEQK